MADRFGNEPLASSPGRRSNAIPQTDPMTYDPAKTAGMSNYFGLYPLQEEAARGVQNLAGTNLNQDPRIDQAINQGIDAQGAASGALDDLNRRYYRGYMDRGSYTMGSLENQYPDLYERERDISTGSINPYMQDVTTRGVDVNRIAELQNPYMDNVVDASLADYDAGVDRASNLQRARQAGAGAFGGRQGLYDATLDAEQARGRGALSSGLRAQSYGQALAAAQQDAAMAQQAERYNQANRLTAGQDQLGREMTADQATARNIMARKQFDVGAAYQGDQQRLGALDRRRQSELQRAQLGQTAFNMGNQQFQQGLLGSQFNLDALRSLYDMGGAQFTQPYQLLGAGTNLFGERGFTNEDEQAQGSSKTTKGSVGFRFGL
tara:strand:+ start:2879 stop:4012 length:1134 start_codon:yes stop_codon:yes gene_type:complete